MGVLLLWMCFLTVLVASGLAVGVLVREARRQLAARRAADVVPSAPASRSTASQRAHVPASRASSSPGAQQPRRGLGQLIPAVPATDGDAPRRRGLGDLSRAGGSPERGQDGRGLGQLLSGHPA